MANNDYARTARQNEQNVLKGVFIVTASANDLIEIHPDFEANSQRDAIASLEANRIDPKFLYVTPRQSELWRQVFLHHSPIHGDPEFTRVYRDAVAKVAGDSPPGPVHLVGLGCGTGVKERDLCLLLKSAGFDVQFSAIDVSRELVAESMQSLAMAGAKLGRSFVCDLARTDDLSIWLTRSGPDVRRVITLFGLVPNFVPGVTAQLMQAVLRPGDVLLVSAHLAPVGQSLDLDSAMHRVLPQYDNPETVAWLTAGLEEWGLENLVDVPEMTVREIEEIPAFVAQARWKSSKPFQKWDHLFFPEPQRPLQVFHSLRYTPALFESLLLKHGFQFERLALTTCREEAIWSVKLRP